MVGSIPFLDAVVVVGGAGVVEVVAGLLPTAATIHGFRYSDQKQMTIQSMDTRQRVEGHAPS